MRLIPEFRDAAETCAERSRSILKSKSNIVFLRAYIHRIAELDLIAPSGLLQIVARAKTPCWIKAEFTRFTKEL